MDKVVFDYVEKQRKKVPHYVVDKLLAWARSVELKGFRAIYTEELDDTVNLVLIAEVNKHDY